MKRKMKRALGLAMVMSFMLSFTACGAPEKPSAPSEPAASGGASTSEPAGPQAGSLGIPVPDSPYNVQFMGATSGGTYFLIANAIADLLNANYSEYFNASVQSSGGTPAILRSLQNEEVEFGIAQAGLAYDARKGLNDFSEKWENYSCITYMFPTVMHLVSQDKEEYQTWKDFEGKSIAVGAVGSATELNSRVLNKAYGVDYDNFASVEYVSESQAVDMLKNKQIVGANLIASVGGASPVDLMSTGGYKIMTFTDEDRDRILEMANSFYPYTIPSGTYANQDYDINTYAVANFLFANNSVPEDVVYAVTKAIYDNLDYLESVYSLMGGVSLDVALDGQTVPLNPGAERYYKEVGVTIPEFVD